MRCKKDETNLTVLIFDNVANGGRLNKAGNKY